MNDVKPITDKIKKLEKPKVTEEEQQKALSDSKAADQLLNSADFKFFQQFLVGEKESIIDNAVNNKLKKIVVKKDGHDVIYERWEQEAEEAGAFKFIYKLIAELTRVKNLPAELDKAIKEGRVVLEK